MNSPVLPPESACSLGSGGIKVFLQGVDKNNYSLKQLSDYTQHNKYLPTSLTQLHKKLPKSMHALHGKFEVFLSFIINSC